MYGLLRWDREWGIMEVETNILSLIANSGDSGMFPVGMVCVIWLLKTVNISMLAQLSHGMLVG